MKPQWRLALVVAAIGCVLFQANLGADDKKAKEPEKKKAEPFKPVIVDGELVNADLKDRIYGQSFCKTYTFKMEKGKSYQIELGSRFFQSAVRLETADGTQVASAVDPFGNQKAVLVFEAPKTQDYQIVATTPQGGAMGKFTLSVKDATGFNILTVNDKLTNNDPAYAGADNKRHKMYLVNLEAGKTYQIDMRSNQFDSYLFLESPDKKPLARDDDGGGYPSARIIHKATETGKFRVIATYFSGLGDFTLTVRLTDGEPPVIDRKDAPKN